jgi:hypothetical protein
MNNISNSSQSESLKKENGDTKLIIFVIASILVISTFLQLWGNISALFYPYAYESIVYSYSVYFILQLYVYAKKGHANFNKLQVMTMGFLIQIMPLLYLLITKQLNVDNIFGGEFDPTLVHLQYSNLLPFIALSILLLPITTPNKSIASERLTFKRKEH